MTKYRRLPAYEVSGPITERRHSISRHSFNSRRGSTAAGYDGEILGNVRSVSSVTIRIKRANGVTEVVQRLGYPRLNVFSQDSGHLVAEALQDSCRCSPIKISLT